MEQSILYPAIRTILGFFLLLLLARMIGRKMISQITFFDFLIAITIGSVLARLAVGERNTVSATLTVLIVLTALAIFIDYIHLKSIKARKLFDSEPIIIIANGKLMDKNMKRSKLTIEELTMMLRENSIFNMADVEFAILETDGKLSTLPKSQKQPLTPYDMGIKASYKGLTKDIIIDGNVMKENLRNANLSEEWLNSNLESGGIKDTKDVFYAGLDSSGNLYISVKMQKRKKSQEYGIE